MTISQRACANRLLTSLHGAALERLMPHLTLVEMTSGDIVFASGTQQADVYFPESATISLSYLAQNGMAAEISIVGSEGMIGIPLFLKGKVKPCSAVVRTSGMAWRISAALLTGEFNRSVPALRVILAYARSLTAQMERSAGCTDDCDEDQPSRVSCSYVARCAQAE